MYSNYSRQIARDSRLEQEHQKIRSAFIAETVRKNGGRLTMEQLRKHFTVLEVEAAIELFRTIHPVTVETRQGNATFYEAN
jgi:hypothetical protein